MDSLGVWIKGGEKMTLQQGWSFYVFRFYNQWKAALKALQFLWVLGGGWPLQSLLAECLKAGDDAL